MSAEVARVVIELREFMYDRVYEPAGAGPEGENARVIVEFLYEHFLAHPDEIPERYHAPGEPADRAAIDYIAGMTDQFALHVAESLRPGIASDAFAGRV